MLDELTPEQQAELVEYLNTELIGEERLDLRFAALMELQYNMARGKRGKKLSISDFMLYPDFAEKRGGDTTASLMASLDASLAAMARRNKGGTR